MVFGNNPEYLFEKVISNAPYAGPSAEVISVTIDDVVDDPPSTAWADVFAQLLFACHAGVEESINLDYKFEFLAERVPTVIDKIGCGEVCSLALEHFAEKLQNTFPLDGNFNSDSQFILGIRWAVSRDHLLFGAILCDDSLSKIVNRVNFVRPSVVNWVMNVTTSSRSANFVASAINNAMCTVSRPRLYDEQCFLDGVNNPNIRRKHFECASDELLLYFTQEQFELAAAIVC
ncbi:hypothetical protein [Schlesneria sp. T3-172]|uniref:hypothetical protein n=1 Tax=Schlesneria sphaerica TaxID=3373610 RepID=UPI0037C668E6